MKFISADGKQWRKYKHLFDVDISAGMRRDPRGMMWLASRVNLEAFDAALHFQFRDSDILSATFPKTGKIIIFTRYIFPQNVGHAHQV